MSYIGNLSTHNGLLGKKGEDFAVDYLIGKGHKILDRNYRTKFGEIDIISIFDSKYYFVEVKTTSSPNTTPEEHIDFRKLKKIAMLAEIYMSKKQNYDFLIGFVGVKCDSNFNLKNINFIENLEI